MNRTKRRNFAKLGLERAKDWLQGAKRAVEDDRWNDVVYSSQMAVEQSVKAVLFVLGVDYPKEHDVSDVFLKVVSEKKLPPWFKDQSPLIADVIAELAEQRGLAGYGFELGVGRRYFKDYAPEALQKAELVLRACEKLFEEL
jgi:HEPN domain-containing protein